MIRTLASLALAGGLALTPVAVGAQTDGVTDRATDRAVTDRQHDHVRDHSRDRPHRDTRFECSLHRSDRRTDHGPVIGCVWTAVGDDRADGYRLWRAVDDGPREVIFETRDNRHHGYRDHVRPGHRYTYAVQYLAADGTVLHTSHPEHVAVPKPDDAG